MRNWCESELNTWTYFSQIPFFLIIRVTIQLCWFRLHDWTFMYRLDATLYISDCIFQIYFMVPLAPNIVKTIILLSHSFTIFFFFFFCMNCTVTLQLIGYLFVYRCVWIKDNNNNNSTHLPGGTTDLEVRQLAFLRLEVDYLNYLCLNSLTLEIITQGERIRWPISSTEHSHKRTYWSEVVSSWNLDGSFVAMNSDTW